MSRPTLCLAAAAVLMAGSPAWAELVYFPSGRVLSVRAIRSNKDQLVLHLRGGGTLNVDKELIARVEPDAAEYSQEALAGMSAQARAIIEPPAIPGSFRTIIASAATRHGVDQRIIHAVIQAESGYKSRAVSPKGARGLMQLMPSTGRQYGALDLFDPAVNIDAGVRHLKTLLQRFDLPRALAAYNAGEAAVDRFKGIPPFRETQDYVARIMRLLDRA